MSLRRSLLLYLQVRVTGALTSVALLENLQLRAGNTTFRLGDCATVTRGYREPPRDKMRFDGKDMIGLGVSMEKGGNIIRLGQGLDALGLHTKPKLRIDVRPGLVVALTIPLVLAITFLFMRLAWSGAKGASGRSWCKDIAGGAEP